MSTTPTTAPAADTATDTTTTQDDLLDARATTLFTKARQAEQRKPPTDRATDKALWAQARRTAATELRRERVRKATAETITNAYADVRSAVHRNRRQLAPWALTTPYAVLGEAAYLTAAYGDGIPIGISAVCAASAVGASLLAWRRKLAARIATRFRAKAQAGMAALCGWTAAMPLVPADGQAGMWLALVGATSYLSLSWWREHSHPIPLDQAVIDLDLEALGLPEEATTTPAEPTEEDLAVARQIIADWDTYVAGMGTLPATRLELVGRIELGWEYRLRLVRGKQKIGDVRAAKETIAHALNLDPKAISIEPDPSPNPDRSMVIFTVVTDTIDTTYTGPRIVRDGGDVFIEIGRYEDGIGCERFHALAGQLSDKELAAGVRPQGSVNGGFALGTKGSGKSRLLEMIAVGLRKLGFEIWFLDPQGGKSSPALMAEADWPLAGLHGTKGAYSNVVDLWRAVTAACEVREAEGGKTEQGFQHTRARPAIMVIIDECQEAFQAENPETGNSFGQDFATLDRKMRKNGVGILGASQAITQDTFGRGNAAAVLRDGMCAVNVLLMAYGGKNLRLAPGYDDQPCASLPVNRGYGYNPKGARPHSRWQTFYTSDYQPWLARYPRGTLDARVAKRIGTPYLKRFEQAAANEAAVASWLDALDACDGDASELPGLDQQPPAAEKSRADSRQAAVTQLLSPAQQRMRAAGQHPTSASTAASATAVAVQTATTEASLTETERRVLDILVARGPQTPTTLADHLGVTSQGAGKHLRALQTKRVVLKIEDGRYLAKP